MEETLLTDKARPSPPVQQPFCNGDTSAAHGCTTDVVSPAPGLTQSPSCQFQQVSSLIAPEGSDNDVPMLPADPDSTEDTASANGSDRVGNGTGVDNIHTCVSEM